MLAGEKGSRRDGNAILFLVVAFIIAGAALILLAGISVIPIETALVLPAFATGFAFIPWYVLGLILVWEQRRGSVLIFDRKSQSFTAGGSEH